jgi:predicted nucleic acid-binding protein
MRRDSAGPVPCRDISYGRRPAGRSGRVRAAGFPDLLIAAVAERERVTLVHYDGDYDLIAEVTGQPMQWVVTPGTVP